VQAVVREAAGPPPAMASAVDGDGHGTHGCPLRGRCGVGGDEREEEVCEAAKTI
jgi:hypothetical protein